MSTKRPSAIGLRKGLGTAPPVSLPEEDPAEKYGFGRNAAPPAPYASPRPEKPARVTLNMPPQLYHDLARWANDASENVGWPRVSIQDALRAMVRVTLADRGIGAVVIDQARRDSEN